jgi:hypothetical protein
MSGYDERAYIAASSALSGLVPIIHRDPVNFLAAAFDGGLFTEAQVEAAKKIVAAKRQIEEEKQQLAAEKQKAEFEAFWSPDVAFPRLFLRRKSDFIGLQNWINKTPVADLEKLLKELNEKTQHYRSIYHYQIGEAIEYLQKAVEQQKGVKS